ncbi:MAG: CerR family C-terminal domain-containing protein [Rhodoferax sp.]|jgi:AcrR family transcriptional regulator|nr:CerR family C-terminal domain-containing protein [Rhodoferax sp.]
MNAKTVDPHRPVRHDGEQSRERLLRVALALFAQKGFEKTSTREIAEAAQTNIAAISYYFGDKAGLYRAVFFESQGSPTEDIARYTDPGLSLEQALLALYASFLEPLRQGELARQCMKLHAREMIEPTGLWEEEISTGIRPMHDALVAVLCRHFQLRKADDDVHRLAVCIARLGVHMHVGRDVTDAIAPTLNARADALDIWSDRLVMYAAAMVHAEGQRRAAAAAGRKAARG